MARLSAPPTGLRVSSGRHGSVVAAPVTISLPVPPDGGKLIRRHPRNNGREGSRRRPMASRRWWETVVSRREGPVMHVSWLHRLLVALVAAVGMAGAAQAKDLLVLADDIPAGS